MVVEKPAESTGLSIRAVALEAGLATMRLDSTDGDSDEDLSELDKDLTSQGTDDTQVVSDLKVQGMAVLDNTRCLIELSHMVKGRAILCGHLRDSCPCRKHKERQKQVRRRGQAGYYQELPNRKGTANDAVADTYLTLEAWVERPRTSRVLLTQLGQAQSPGKAAMDASMKPRSAPVVRIDTTPRGPRAAQLQAWAQVVPTTPQAAPAPTTTPAGIATAPPTNPGGPLPILKVNPGIVSTQPPGPAVPTGSVAQPDTPVFAPSVLKQAPIVSTTPPAPQPATKGTPTGSQPSPVPPTAPMPTTPTTVDPAMIQLLSGLVDKVDVLNSSHQTTSEEEFTRVSHVRTPRRNAT
jgi:hypothetical protein